MVEISLELAHHNSVRLVKCCLCLRNWEEWWISARLFRCQGQLGPICPRCVADQPIAIGSRFRWHADQIRRNPGTVEHVPNCVVRAGMCQSIELVKMALIQKHAQAIYERERTKHLLAEAGMLVSQLSKAIAASEKLIMRLRGLRRRNEDCGDEATSDERIWFANLLDAFADEFPRSSPWEVTIDQMVTEETSAFVFFNPELKTFRVRDSIQARYAQFLSLT